MTKNKTGEDEIAEELEADGEYSEGFYQEEDEEERSIKEIRRE